MEQARNIILQNDYTNFEEAISTANHLINSLAQLKRAELKRIQGQTGSLKVSMVYLTMIQEAQKCRSLHQQFTESQPKISSRRIILKRFIKRVRTLN